MIVLDNVSLSFGSNKAVDSVSFQVESGEIFGLVGPDGAGKTTLIRMLTGLLKPAAGKLSVLGSANPEAVKDQLGYVPQRFSLYGDLTVLENIRVMGMLYGQTTAQIDALATQVLGFTKLLPFHDRLADNLSGGMKQKLALAAGLMHRPTIYFLDEPTTGVDPVSRREFWQMLYGMNKEGTTIFVSTPYMDEAEFCTKIAFLHNGRLVACDSPQNLRRQYPYHVLELATPEREVKKHLTECPLLDINMFGEKFHLVVEDVAAASDAVRTALERAGITFTGLVEIPPTLEDVFVVLASEVA